MTIKDFIEKVEAIYPHLLAGARPEWHWGKILQHVACQAGFRPIQDHEDKLELLRELWIFIDTEAAA